MSGMKLILGHSQETFFESFWNIQGITFLHYIIPMIIIAILMPVFIKVVLKENGMNFIKIFDSCAFLVFFFSIICTREFNNLIFCFTFMIAALLALVTYVHHRNDILEFALNDRYMERIRKLTIVLLYWIITVVIYSPNELYLTNSDDFPISYWYFFGKLLLAGILMFAIALVGGMAYLAAIHVDMMCGGLFALVTMGYIQGMFLNGNMNNLDGDIQKWDNSRIAINLILWIVVIAVFMGFYIKKRIVAEKVVKFGSIWLILIQMVSLVVLIITSDGIGTKSGLELTTNGMLEIGDENNILVFVLDKFDGRRISEILDDEPDFLEPLSDFTYYTNVTSEFYPTYCSIAYLITGTEYEDDNSDYYSYVFSGDNILVDELYQQGYDIGLYTSTNYVSEDYSDIVTNYEEGIERKCSMYDLASLMSQTSKYKMSPLVGKNYYVYDSSDIYLLTYTDNLTNIENDLPFYNRLIGTGLSVNEDIESGTFKFYHMHGAHPPYIMSEDFQYIEYDWRRDGGYGVSGTSQAKGALNIVYEYIRQLKELGKYDDATIIITADHGVADVETKSDGEMVQQSWPILFVKMPYETSDTMIVNQSPVAHSDVVSTIKYIAGLDDYGSVLADYSEDDDRVRTSIIRYDDVVIKYEIDGDVSDVDNWTEIYNRQ
jgi:hypothetical protein